MYKQKFDLTGSRAVITGGGRGIGLASAEALAEHGAAVILCDIDEAVLKAGQSALAEKGYRAEIRKLNVADSAEVAEVARELNASGPVDILLANAGVAQADTPAESLADADWRRMIDINVDGVFWCCRKFGRAMLQRNNGAIVTIGSMSGLISNKPQRQAHYNASKAAVHHLTKSLAGEWADRGVRVNSVAPTYIDTAMTAGAAQHPEMFAVWMDQTPMRRMGKPEEIAACVLFLASPASSLLTGAVIVADGGYTVW